MFLISHPDDDRRNDDALFDERNELVWLARTLLALRPDLDEPLETCVGALDQALQADGACLGREQALDGFARSLRQTWLQAVAAETSRIMRSPTNNEALRLFQRHDAFGYERDFQPRELEAALLAAEPAADFARRREIILFSSAQAAMTTLLLALQSEAPKRVALLGAYFETRALLEGNAALRGGGLVDDARAADIVIVEPIACDGAFSHTDIRALAEALNEVPKPRSIIADTTLCGPGDALAPLLKQAPDSAHIFTIDSGLKLMQAGLELANVGVVVAHVPAGRADVVADIRRLRTLTGSGLRFVDALALQAPWFADRAYTMRYVHAVFAHNAALASAVARANQRFAPVRHPSFDGRGAPYCVFQLARGGEAALNDLAAEIAQDVETRGIAFDRGGSFGFRHCRYDVVVPESDEPPFLRVAMGRRGGWSCDGVIALMAEIAARAPSRRFGD
jgi:hypothetical protein